MSLVFPFCCLTFRVLCVIMFHCYLKLPCYAFVLYDLPVFLTCIIRIALVFAFCCLLFLVSVYLLPYASLLPAPPGVHVSTAAKEESKSRDAACYPVIRSRCRSPCCLFYAFITFRITFKGCATERSTEATCPFPFIPYLAISVSFFPYVFATSSSLLSAMPVYVSLINLHVIFFVLSYSVFIPSFFPLSLSLHSSSPYLSCLWYLLFFISFACLSVTVKHVPPFFFSLSLVFLSFYLLPSFPLLCYILHLLLIYLVFIISSVLSVNIKLIHPFFVSLVSCPVPVTFSQLLFLLLLLFTYLSYLTVIIYSILSFSRLLFIYFTIFFSSD